MRTIIDLPQEHVETLDRLGAVEQKSRAALVREAVAAYLAERLQPDAVRPAFGIWRDDAIDGLEYQRQLREEWDA